MVRKYVVSMDKRLGRNEQEQLSEYTFNTREEAYDKMVELYNANIGDIESRVSDLAKDDNGNQMIAYDKKEEETYLDVNVSEKFMPTLRDLKDNYDKAFYDVVDRLRSIVESKGGTILFPYSGDNDIVPCYLYDEENGGVRDYRCLALGVRYDDLCIMCTDNTDEDDPTLEEIDNCGVWQPMTGGDVLSFSTIYDILVYLDDFVEGCYDNM